MKKRKSYRYSRPPQYRRSRDSRKSGGIRKSAVLGVIYNLKNLIWDLEMGGGIGGEAVLAGAVLGGGGGATV